jgi:hypothetical protein
MLGTLAVADNGIITKKHAANINDRTSTII